MQKEEVTSTQAQTDGAVVTNDEVSFADFDLKPQLQKAIKKLGYTHPTQIQKDVWEASKNGANIVGQSQTGTGKTTAFLLPLLQKIDGRQRYPQVLIVAPTRELVMQIREDIMKLTEFLPMRSMVLMGGKSMRFQKEDLSFGPQFIVATPGRLIEFMQNRYLDVSRISHFVLDEVDRMLDMGFIEDVDRIWSQLENLQQTMTFSATINQEIRDVIKKHCPEYEYLRVGQTVTVDKINHALVEVPHEHKYATLVSILEKFKGEKTLIFSQTKRNTEVLAKELQQEKVDGKKLQVQYLNGDLDMRHRTRTLRSFKDGSCNILITTDVAARGLNMDNVELVINFDVPREAESYIHRIGRTGRAGASGKALTLVDKDERHLVMDIEKKHNTQIKRTTKIEPVTDKLEEYIDVNLDRPLPPSDKKRRMVARSIARSYREQLGGDRSRSQGPRGDRGRTGRFGSDRTRSDRGRSGSFDSGRSRFDSSRSRSEGPRTERSSRPERFTSDKPRTSDSRASTSRTGGYTRERVGRSERPERRERPERSYQPRETSRRQPASIGGYDVAQFSAQRKEEQAKFTRRPRQDSDRPARPFDKKPGDRRSFDRKGTDRFDRPSRSFDRKPTDRKPADRGSSDRKGFSRKPQSEKRR